MKTRTNIFYLLLLVVLVQCKSNNSHNVLPSNADSALADTAVKVTYLLRSPEEMLHDIFTDKVTLNPDLVNPQSNSYKYFDEKAQAINLGVYIADFAYLNLNENKANAIEYFKIIRSLTEKINIYGLIEKSFFDRINSNLMNNDSLAKIMQEMYYNISEILENSNRQNVYALISAGTIIETLYLSVMSVTKYSDYQSIAHEIFRQKQIFNSFYSFASSFKDDNDIRAVLKQLIKLKSILDASVVNNSEISVNKEKGKHFSIHGGEKIIINEKIFLDFKENVKITRQNIIKVSNN
jgi:hypothetical protein